jgi:hypothetical protein
MKSASRLHFVQRRDAAPMRCGDAMAMRRRCDCNATAQTAMQPRRNRRRNRAETGAETAQKPAQKTGAETAVTGAVCASISDKNTGG